jgi:hypothetical protein
MGIPSSSFFNASLIIFFYVLKYQSQILLYRFNNKCGADANLRKYDGWKDDPPEGKEFRHDSQCEGEDS